MKASGVSSKRASAAPRRDCHSPPGARPTPDTHAMRAATTPAAPCRPDGAPRPRWHRPAARRRQRRADQARGRVWRQERRIAGRDHQPLRVAGGQQARHHAGQRRASLQPRRPVADDLAIARVAVRVAVGADDQPSHLRRRPRAACPPAARPQLDQPLVTPAHARALAAGQDQAGERLAVGQGGLNHRCSSFRSCARDRPCCARAARNSCHRAPSRCRR